MGKVGRNPLSCRESGRKTFLPAMSYESGSISAIKEDTNHQLRTVSILTRQMAEKGVNPNLSDFVVNRELDQDMRSGIGRFPLEHVQ
jgi:hypothetical protein